VPKLTPALVEGFPKSGPTDPIGYYRWPIVGFLYRERINMGLRMLGDRPRGKVLELGYGSGTVLLTLAPIARELHGVDLDADPAAVGRVLAERGVTAQLQAGNAYELPFEDASFDLVVSYSMFEHLREYPRALSEVARVMRPSGEFLLGMPAVNRAMEWGFLAMGIKDINDHHVTTPRAVSQAFGAAGLSVIEESRLGVPRLPGAAVYYTWLLRKGS
jgi:SAM-dependent methyltransferase